MKNNLFKKENSIVRVLDEKDDKTLIIDCLKKTMPIWADKAVLNDYKLCSEEELDYTVREIDSLSAAEKRIMHERYTLIAGILPFVSDERLRGLMISKVSEQMQVSKQTVRKYLCLYLSYQNMTVLAPNKAEKKRELTQDEKNIRWAINKFFYTMNKNSLMTAYTMMLKEKYCDSCGNLNSSYPTFYQFRYYYRKHRNLQKFNISHLDSSIYFFLI